MKKIYVESEEQLRELFHDGNKKRAQHLDIIIIQKDIELTNIIVIDRVITIRFDHAKLNTNGKLYFAENVHIEWNNKKRYSTV